MSFEIELLKCAASAMENSASKIDRYVSNADGTAEKMSTPLSAEARRIRAHLRVRREEVLILVAETIVAFTLSATAFAHDQHFIAGALAVISSNFGIRLARRLGSR